MMLEEIKEDLEAIEAKVSGLLLGISPGDWLGLVAKIGELQAVVAEAIEEAEKEVMKND